MTIEQHGVSFRDTSRAAAVLVLHLALVGPWALGCNGTDAKNQAADGSTPKGTGASEGSGDSAPRGTAPIADVADPASGSGAGHVPATTLKPREFVDRMIKAYREAKTYADAGQVRIKLDRPNQPSQDLKPFIQSVSFVRPNKIRLECFDSVLVCDGKKLLGSVATVAQQVLELDAPEKLRIDDLMAGEALSESLTQGPAGFPLQLPLLLPDATLPETLQSGQPTLLAGDTFDGHDCQRVQFETPEGPWIFWIDPRSYVLRLMELPVGGIRKQLEAQGPIKRLSLTVELLGARLNEPVPQVAFDFEVPAEAKRVKRLIGPPPAPPSELLGHAVPEFNFTGVNAKAVSRASLAGKVAVLDFWFTACAPCQQAFPMLNQVYQKYKNSDRVVFVAVSIDPPEVEDVRLGETARQWGGEFPLARDTARHADSVFHIPGAPSLIVLGPDGTVQDQEVGLNPKLATDLPAVIEALLAGKSTAADAKARAEQLTAEYERAIQEPPVRAESSVEPLPDVKIVARDEPHNMKLAHRWATTDIKNPGNILVVDDAKNPQAPPRIFVLEGAHTVVELNGAGQTVGRHELAIPQQAIVNFLRTAVDAAGKRYYAGSASGQQQLFLFDEKWTPLVRFPSEDQGTHAGIGDVQFVDLEGKGEPVLSVGYWGLVGVQGVSLTGKRLWTDRSMQYVLRLAAGGRNAKGQRRLLCTNSRGSLVPIDATGAPEPEWLLPGLMLETVASSEAGNGETDVCALASNLKREPLVVGVGPHGEDQWHYPLPRGIYRTPIEPITSARLIGLKRHWLIASPDGAIHFVAGDGTPLDSFHYGQALGGLAGARVGDEALLIVANARGVEAWKVEPKQAK
jgi:thiol-disulfide isomerase/thioredoxin